MMKKGIIVVLAFLGGMTAAWGQQDALFTQYIDAQLYSNAAYAGSNDVLSITALHRQQWAGFSGAPITTGIMIHSPLAYESVGLGLEVWNDRVGTLNRTTVAGNFAYRFKVGNEGRLALGIKGMADFNSPDYSSVSNTGSDAIVLGVTSSVTPNAGIGLLYKSPKWFVGMGVPRILKNDDAATSAGYRNNMHAYFLTGAVFTLNQKWKLRPSTQIRMVKASPLSADITGTFIYDDRFYIGINHRFSESIGILAQYQISAPLKIGYSFDYGVNSLRSVNAGSHEILLSFDMNFDRLSVMSPRYF